MKTSTKTLASKALANIRTILANDEGRKARLQAMADRIAEKARLDPRRIGCGETFDDLKALGAEGSQG